VTTKKFQSSQAWQQKSFNYQSCDDGIFFNHHMFLDLGRLIDGGLISTIDLDGLA
jgi:hypothetical protein